MIFNAQLKTIRSTRNLILIIILSALFFGSQVIAAGVKNLPEIKKDIRVISNVLETSTELEGSRSRVKVSGDYLAKQGIVLKVRFPGRNNYNFDFNFSDFGSIAPVPVIPQVFASDEDISAIVADSMELAELAILAPEATDSYSSFSTKASTEKKALRNQQRELRKQQRELEKKARKIEREMRTEEVKKNRKDIQKQQAEFKKMRLAMKAKAQQMKAKLLTLKKNEQASRQKKMDNWTNSLLANFCSYAPYPRNLPTNEYLTLVIAKAVYVENRLQDKIFVFNNSQLKSCRDGKIKGQDLLTKSLVYTF